MKKLNNKLVVFLPEESIEEAARAQLENLAKMPFIHSHVAAMPDCHYGMGATVGSVIATRDAIIPAAVGVDIGCGMIAVKTTLTAADLPEDLSKMRQSIERSVPSSAGHYNNNLTDSAKVRVQHLSDAAKDIDYKALDKNWELQLGTLGGGNHFIEVCLDENEDVWVVLHSGSRGVGNKIAMKHIAVAKKLMKNMFIDLADPDLAYLPMRMPGFSEYMRDLKWAQEFALLNREEMMDRVLKDVSYTVFGENKNIEESRINCHHNFTECEHHMGQNVWVTRKGAIQMKKGQLGVIPGSMGTRSYIVSGKENAMSFHSAPHGAGRRMSRKQARQEFTMDDYREAMKGIECCEEEVLLDEIPGAYKDIDDVMEHSRELVDVVHTLKQVLNVKGN